MTLIELLVVLAIVVMISAITIPLMNNNMHERRMREAARMLNTYLQGARARAMETGRPVGVIFEVDIPTYDSDAGVDENGDPTDEFGTSEEMRRSRSQICSLVSYVDQPWTYTGLTYQSRCRVYNWRVQAVDGEPAVFNIDSDGSVGAEPLVTPLVQPGDLLRFDYHGAKYLITEVSDSGWSFVPLFYDPSLTNATAASISPSYPQGVPFQVYRRPQKTMASPLQMPDGTIVDLRLSGMPGTSFGPGPVVLMFSPEGTPSLLYYQVEDGSGNIIPVVQPPGAPIHFLVGKRDHMGLEQGETISNNLYDLQNFWVTVYGQTGRVKTDPIDIVPDDASTPFEKLLAARYLAYDRTEDNR